MSVTGTDRGREGGYLERGFLLQSQVVEGLLGLWKQLVFILSGMGRLGAKV